MTHLRLAERAETGPHLTEHQHIGINGRIATTITNAVGTMWCAYAFALIAFVSLPTAVKSGFPAVMEWISHPFLPLVLLSVLMVGQKVAARASDKQAAQIYKDAETLLQMQDDMHQLIKLNKELTEEIHQFITKGKGAD